MAASPVPKLGPPLNARPDQRWPCMTPALTSSRKRYNESWNLSTIRAPLIALYMARASVECMCVFKRNLGKAEAEPDAESAIGCVRPEKDTTKR